MPMTSQRPLEREACSSVTVSNHLHAAWRREKEGSLQLARKEKRSPSTEKDCHMKSEHEELHSVVGATRY